MPKIQWTDLPVPLRDHLLERLRERKITTEDDAPDGLWYKGFRLFQDCGEGKYPKTFLLRSNRRRGKGCKLSEVPGR